MIFVTVGTQLSFDRLVSAVDAWVGTSPGVEVVAQIGPSALKPANLAWSPFLSAELCRKRVQQAELVVAHAGMGSILTALELGKRLIVMPRRSALNEHRNDHQVATAKRLQEQGRALVVYDEDQLLIELGRFRAIPAPAPIEPVASPQLIARLRGFVGRDLTPTNGRSGVESVAIPDSLWDSRYIDLPHTATPEPARNLPSVATENGLVERTSKSPGPVPSVTVDPSGIATATRTRARVQLGRMASGTMSLSRVRDIIWLVGPLGHHPIEAQTGRSLLDLPIRRGQTLRDAWRDEVARVLPGLAAGAKMRVVVSATGAAPPLSPQDHQVGISVERDPNALRGTGGVLRDLASGYEADDCLLVISGVHALMRPFDQIVSSLTFPGDLNLLIDPAGNPSGIMLARCGVLEQIPSVGFVDFKEQALPMLAKSNTVRVRRTDRPSTQSIRTAKEYLEAVQQQGRIELAQSAGTHFFEEKWYAGVSIVEDGAWVDPAAHLHSSVVLSGARVDQSVVARSLVCCGATVRSGQVVIDAVVSAGAGN